MRRRGKEGVFFVPSRSVGSENGFVMGQGVLVEQFDELLKVSKGMRFVAAYMCALVGALSVGSLVVLRVAFVTGEWIIAVPIPLLFILIFLLVNAGRGIKMRLQASRREAVTLHWMGGALGFIFTVWCVARAVMRVDVAKPWVSVGEVLLGVLSAVFFACGVFCAIYLEEADGADRYFGGKMAASRQEGRGVRRGAAFGARGSNAYSRPFGFPYR